MFISNNVRRLYGLDPEESCQGGHAYWLSKVHPEDIDKVKEAYELLFASGKKFDVEYRIQTYAGRWTWIRDISVRLYEKQGVKYADGFFSDITTVDRDAVQRLKQDFINVVSHEIRTPLTIVDGNIALLLEQLLGTVDERQEKVLVTAKKSIKRVSNVMINLLEMSMLQEGSAQLEIERVDISVLIGKAIEPFTAQIKKKGLDLKVNCPRGRIYVYVDPDKITCVISHLVANAVRFTETGHIEISVVDKGDGIECFVKDTGAGIAQEDIALAFDKFQQIGRAEGNGDRGTGLGLPIAKGFIEMHNGKIWIESEPGKGTKISFRLSKYSTELLFCVNRVIREAKKENSKVSLIMILIPRLTMLRRKWPREKLENFLLYIEGTLNNCGDVVVKNCDEFVTILKDRNKEQAMRIERRLTERIEYYIDRQHTAEDIEVRSACAAYPNDAKYAKGLIKRMRDKLKSDSPMEINV